MKNTIRKFSFIYCGCYGLFLGALILSWHVMPGPLLLFMKKSYIPTQYYLDWMDWLAIGSLYVGITNLLACSSIWSDASRRQLSVVTGLLYLSWGIMNLHHVVETERYNEFMWLNVMACFLGAALSFFAFQRGRPT